MRDTCWEGVWGMWSGDSASTDSEPVFKFLCRPEAAQAASEPFQGPNLWPLNISQGRFTQPERCRDAPCVCVNEPTVLTVPAGAPPTLSPGRAAAPRAAKRKKTNKTSWMLPGAARPVLALSLPLRDGHFTAQLGWKTRMLCRKKILTVVAACSVRA